MPNYIRTQTAGATYFFTVTLENRGERFLVDHVAELRACLKTVKERHPFDIEAMVVLPEHIHALWRLPVEDGDYATRWMLLKQTFTRRLSELGVLPPEAEKPRGRRGERSVWQKRFWEHQIRDDEEFARHVDYIHFNPVKHGWVLRARDWPYSSLHRFVREGRLPEDWGISAAIEGEFGE
jgi:putative transposase